MTDEARNVGDRRRVDDAASSERVDRSSSETERVDALAAGSPTRDPRTPDIDPDLDADAHLTTDGDAPAGPSDAAGQVDDVIGASEQPDLDDPRSREELLVALLDAETARDEYLDDVRRARADFDNYRRRMMREGATQRDAGRTEVVESLLDVLDDLDRTLEASTSSGDDALARGIDLVATKLRSTLEGQGLVRIDAVEVPFDPEQHEAVQHRPDDEHDTPTVVEVLRPGYRWGERVLRAAMVVVAD